MTFEEIHREQARYSDATADVADLHGVAPPCRRWAA